jgi:putative transposase
MISAPDRQRAVELIQEAVAAGATAHRACAQLGLTLRTYQRWTQGGNVRADARPQAARPAPANKLSAQERQAILDICNQGEYASLPPAQVVPKLADAGRYLASEASFYRVLRGADQLHHRGKAQAPRRVSKPKSYAASAANQVWTWDITYLATTVLGLFFRLYLVMDIYSRKIVGWEVHESETAEHAAVLIRKAGLAEGVHQAGLVLHSDNGAPMKGATLLATLQRLGIVPSFSRPAVSNDNPYSESLFGTLKYTPAFPDQPFASLEAARAWVATFVQWYNEHHQHSGIRFVTPAARHSGAEAAILQHRKAVYEAAKQRHPQRWSGATRNWEPVGIVWLNPDKPDADKAEIRDCAA